MKPNDVWEWIWCLSITGLHKTNTYKMKKLFEIPTPGIELMHKMNRSYPGCVSWSKDDESNEI